MKKNLSFESVNDMEVEINIEMNEEVDTEYIDENDSEEDSGQPTSPLKAIRKHCMDCCGQQRAEVKMCPCTNCPLYPFRMGKNPFRKRTLTDEQRLQARDRLANARSKKKKKEMEMEMEED